jgi:hypothetical protein|uniref:DUF1492 domain-containing protein n=1 Tax=Myoviridae sp. ct25F5 TaxID=2826604 RepID=A0A8S5LTK4_9CAUD|nr:MAG TPA: Protein of unknown function (DUF1492) [Myoviridae sp. ct25F5]
MTDVKAYLKRIKLYDTHIDNKIAEVDRLEAMATKITQTLRDDAGGGSRSQDKIGDAAARIIDLKRELNRDIDCFVDMKREIKVIVDKVDDANQLSVIYKRYFLYETFEQIACEMNMTFRNVCYIHGKALEAVEILLKKEKIS